MKNCNRKKIIFPVVFTLIIVLLISLIEVRKYNKKYKHINTKQISIIDYIKAADEASKGKLQVNWKQMAAIDGVRYKNDFSNCSKDSMRNLAEMFIAENKGKNKVKGSNYRLKEFDEIMEQLSFDKNQKKRAEDYLKDLQYIGLVKQNLAADSYYLEFINEIKGEAIEGYKESGILPSVTISQAILESGWGASDLAMKANNLFGVKADKSWKGKKIDMKTTEYNNETITASFRVYESTSESIKDHRKFLVENPRYRQAGVFSAKHYIEQAQAIEKGGYSTVENKNGDKIYSEMLISIIREYNLQLIDYEVEMQYLKGQVK